MGDATNGYPVASSTSDFVQEMTADALLSDDNSRAFGTTDPSPNLCTHRVSKACIASVKHASRQQTVYSEQAVAVSRAHHGKTTLLQEM